MIKGLFIRIDPALDNALTEVCRREGYKKSGLVTKLIRDFIEQKKAETRDPIQEARDFGIDLSLLDENLKKTPTERLKDMSQASKFIQDLQLAMQKREGRTP